MNGLLNFAISLKNESDARESISITNNSKYLKNVFCICFYLKASQQAVT